MASTSRGISQPSVRGASRRRTVGAGDGACHAGLVTRRRAGRDSARPPSRRRTHVAGAEAWIPNVGNGRAQDLVRQSRRRCPSSADGYRLGRGRKTRRLVVMSLVLLPHLTMWRFGTGNRERWVATDLTRHTWARLWWQATVFAGQEDLLNAMSESDLNQLLERRRIGGDPRLVCCLARAVVAAPTDVPRRFVIRDSTRRLRRWLAFLDASALNVDQMNDVCSELVSTAARNYATSGSTDAEAPTEET